ncbi:LacI family DNA-binding transcriptional regulator [Vibrio viridaestus]|uniref:Autoinducer 2-binding periplasmic protein LuxP n=1 Tax=Vibrio viridaestus TaxID=2487322 RepID=A0A3N9TKU2_9VIBR|nr:LacI family DNA-binding transcriptional regulator [Vibrio viridaestus]RQW64483.1 LacI family transcriptional regulator [Vibrio viridaestus]
MKHITIADVAKLAGVGTATVDRVLNGRSSTRPETQDKVLAAARDLGYRVKQSQLLTTEAKQQVKSLKSFRVGFILLSDTHSFYRSLSESLMETARQFTTATPEFAFFHLSEVDQVANTIMKFGEEMDAIGLISLDHPLVRHAVEEVAKKGVKVFTIVSDLSPCNHSATVGFDDKKVGRTAGWAVHHFFPNAVKIGIVIGDNRFLCQETYEIGFRSYLREIETQYQVLEPVKSYESIEGGYKATVELLNDHPDLSLIYAPCGGVEGIAQALTDLGKNKSIKLICHGPIIDYQLKFIDGTIDLMFNHPITDFTARIMQLCQDLVTGEKTGFEKVILKFDIITKENM